jgi:hypothetical protein
MWIYPIWALVVLTLNMMIIHALTAHGEEFE